MVGKFLARLNMFLAFTYNLKLNRIDQSGRYLIAFEFLYLLMITKFQQYEFLFRPEPKY